MTNNTYEIKPLSICSRRIIPGLFNKKGKPNWNFFWEDASWTEGRINNNVPGLIDYVFHKQFYLYYIVNEDSIKLLEEYKDGPIMVPTAMPFLDSDYIYKHEIIDKYIWGYGDNKTLKELLEDDNIGRKQYQIDQEYIRKLGERE